MTNRTDKRKSFLPKLLYALVLLAIVACSVSTYVYVGVVNDNHEAEMTNKQNYIDKLEARNRQLKVAKDKCCKKIVRPHERPEEEGNI